ncbi:MAG TPA: SMP-30/gluconolactonase/LRE family protein [Gammaproteobacteria bacterium]|nr:SMP-30/gluconolactonase/LRE family protein [Gammaproteobacteria bacterium]
MTTTRTATTRLLFAAGAAAWLAACNPEPQVPAERAADGASRAPAAGAPSAAPAAQPRSGSADAPNAPAGGSASGLPARIVAKRGGFIPEGVEYDEKNRRFLTGSLAEGTIFRIDADGSVVPFVMDPELVSSVGIEVDEARDRLLVCNSDRAVFDGKSAGQAKLGIYNLTSGERIAMVDLTASMRRKPENAAFFANDVTVDDDGNVYVTDTRQNAVYKVGSDQKPAILYRFEPAEGLALNGIVYAEGGYLIVIGGPKLYKVTTGDPAKLTEVKLDAPIPGADGMVFLPDGRLAVVSNSQSKVFALESDDGWDSASMTATAPFEGQATTAAVAGADVYVVQPHFNDQEPPVIERVSFR